MPGKRVAVMQPYFFPYAGYYRLLAMVDEFIVFDCVQFPRRGRVHRTEVPGPDGKAEWLTLPLARQSRDVLIRDLAFTSDARATLDQRLARYEWFRQADGSLAERIKSHLYAPLDSVLGFLELGLQLVAGALQFDAVITRSSTLALDPALRGQARVVAAAAAAGASYYVNAPGGVSLYDADTFARSNIELSFLCPYEGRFSQMLPALMTQPPELIRTDILRFNRLMNS